VIVNVDENKMETADELAGFVPNVIVTHPLAPEDNLVLYRQLGTVFGKEREAERLCDRFELEYEEMAKRKFRSRKILYLIWKDPWMTVSRDTYVSRMLALVGLDTLPEQSDARYPELKEPGVTGAEMLLLSSEPYRFTERHKRELEQEQRLPVHLIDGEMTSWYGPRAIAGLAYLADFSSRLT
jgi:ABC-type Fe3+-hydroxamate transport system substrate-binding protein